MEAQLLQEIKIQMFSNHPNILKMYGFFADESKIYLILELATNGCLFREIRQKAYFS
jgi:serine/threonine protein kinase